MGEKWYAATLIFRIRVENFDRGLWTCDEQIRVLKAVDANQAYRYAMEIGKADEISYLNNDGDKVYWELVGIEELEELSAAEIVHGTEISSRLFDHENPDALISEKDELQVFRAERLSRSKLTAEEIIRGMETKPSDRRGENGCCED